VANAVCKYMFLCVVVLLQLASVICSAPFVSTANKRLGAVSVEVP